MSKISCKKFTDYLIRRMEHFDSDLIRDITPTDGWIGHVNAGRFPDGEGVERQFDRLHRVYPDLSGEWQDVVVGHCEGTPCDPEETEIGFGYTQESYALQQKSYKTDLFCFDQMMSADRAKEQFAQLVTNLKDASNIIVSDRLKVEALRIAGTKVVASANLAPFTYTSTGNLINVTPSAFPTSIVTIEMLQRFVQPLMMEGALGADPSGPPVFEYVTDIETAWNLREGKSSLTNLFRFTDFARGGALYKYGITDAIGNFGIRADRFPLRFQICDDPAPHLVRVFPYRNVGASGSYGGDGIRGIVNDDYLQAEVQIDFIWNRMAMQSQTRDNSTINPMMPFAKRDFAGKWQFVMDNLGADKNGCVIENKRRNKGQFIADFSFATKPIRPEWVVAIMHLRQRSCVTAVSVCAGWTPNECSPQDYNSANDHCEEVIAFEVCDPGEGEFFTLAAGAITCDDINIAHPALTLADEIDTLADLATWLNENLSELGVFSVVTVEDTDTLRLVTEVCEHVVIPIVCEAPEGGG